MKNKFIELMGVVVFLAVFFAGAMALPRESEYAVYVWFAVVCAIYAVVLVAWSKSQKKAFNKQIRKLGENVGFRLVRGNDKMSFFGAIKYGLSGPSGVQALKSKSEDGKHWESFLEGGTEGQFVHVKRRNKGGDTPATYTVVSAYVPNHSTFSFSIGKEDILSKTAKNLGLDDIKLNHDQIDSVFYFKASREALFRKIMDDRVQAGLLEVMPSLKGEVRFSSGLLEYWDSSDLHSDECRERFERVIPFFMLLIEQMDAVAGMRVRGA